VCNISTTPLYITCIVGVLRVRPLSVSTASPGSGLKWVPGYQETDQARSALPAEYSSLPSTSGTQATGDYPDPNPPSCKMSSAASLVPLHSFPLCFFKVAALPQPRYTDSSILVLRQLSLLATCQIQNQPSSSTTKMRRTLRKPYSKRRGSPRPMPSSLLALSWKPTSAGWIRTESTGCLRTLRA